MEILIQSERSILYRGYKNYTVIWHIYFKFANLCFRYINTINLQIEVTKNLQRYLDNLDVIMAGSPAQSPGGAAALSPRAMVTSPSDSGPPTLFGSTRMKVEVVYLVSHSSLQNFDLESCIDVRGHFSLKMYRCCWSNGCEG